jgi:hypothetical protein
MVYGVIVYCLPSWLVNFKPEVPVPRIYVTSYKENAKARWKPEKVRSLKVNCNFSKNRVKARRLTLRNH